MIGIRQLGLTSAVVAGIVALSLLGEPVSKVAAVAALLCIAAPLIRGGLQRVPWPLITGPVMIGIAFWLWAGANRQQALGFALIYLQVHRVLARRVAADDRVSVLLSGLMIVACASNTEDPIFLLVVVCWALALPVALLPHLTIRARGLGRTAIAMSAGTFLFAAALFVVLPRVSSVTEGLEDGASRTGFTDVVELGVFDELFNDDGEVFRVTMNPPAVGPVYFRGVALDLFDGRNWSRSVPPSGTDFQSEDSFPADAHRMVITLQNHSDGVLFTAGELLYIEAEGRGLRRDPQGAWFVDGPPGTVQYTIVGQGPLGLGGPPVGGSEAPAFPLTAIPEDLDPRIRDLAEEIVGDETDVIAQTTLIGDRLRSDYTYTRVPLDQGEERPLSVFLFERQTGHCEYFAASQAILLRTLGVPTRLVNGFAGGELDPATGELVFRGYNAHSWVEYYVEGQGWLMADATPGPEAVVSPPAAPSFADAITAFWDTSILGWDRDAQLGAVISAGRRVERALPVVADRADRVPFLGLGLLVGLSALVGGAIQFVMDRWINSLAGDTVVRPRGPVANQHNRARRHLESQGWRIPVCLPPLEAARWVQARTTEDATALEELAWLHYYVRYGKKNADSSGAMARSLAERVMELGPPC